MSDATRVSLLVVDPIQERVAQVRDNGAWTDISLPIAEQVELLRTQIRRQEDFIEVLSAAVRTLSSDLPNSGTAQAQQSIFTRVTKTEDSIEAVAEEFTGLEVTLDGKASSAAQEALTTRVTENEKGIEAEATKVTALQTAVAGKAESTALDELSTKVTTNESSIEAEAKKVTTLQSEITEKATSTAVDALTTRVKTNEDTITSESQKLTTLTSTVNGKAESKAVEALTTRVTSAEGTITTEAAKVSALETSVAGKANTTAVDTLETKVTANETAITAEAAKITSLQTAVDGKANTTAVDGLTTRVDAAETTITAEAAKISALQTSLGDKADQTDLDLKADTTAVDALTTRVSTNETTLTAESKKITGLQTSLAGKADTTDLASKADATAVTALETKVTANESAITANASSITTLQATIGDGIDNAATISVDHLVFHVPAAVADDAGELVYAGRSIQAGTPGSEGTFEIQTVSRNGRRFSVTLTPAGDYTWPTGALSVIPTGWGNRAVIQPRTRASTLAAANTSSEWAVQTTTSIPALSQAQEILEAEVTAQGDDVTALARWLVKTKVGDRVGGVGLYNDGSTVEFIVDADKFAIVPPGWDGTDENVRVPFAVTDGKVYLDDAVIREASIGTAAIANAAITNAKIKDADITFAKMTKADIFDLTVDNTIKSGNYAQGKTGWIIRKNGNVEFNDGTWRGNLQSSNFAAGKTGWQINKDGTVEFNAGTWRGSLQSSNFDAGKTGWKLDQNGTAEFDAAAIRGVLSATHIDADVQNVRVLWTGSQHVANSFQDITLGAGWQNFDFLDFYVVSTNEGSAGNIRVETRLIPAGNVPSTIGQARGTSAGYISDGGSTSTGAVAWFTLKTNEGDGGGVYLRVWRRSSTQIRVASAALSGSQQEGVIRSVTGIRQPGSELPPITAENISVAGFLSAGGNVTAGGDVDATDNITAGGDVTATGTVTGADVTYSSDIRHKENIVRMTGALDKIDEICGYTFTMFGQEHAGLIAQEVAYILPEAVRETNSRLTISPAGVLGLLVEAVKELREELRLISSVVPK